MVKLTLILATTLVAGCCTPEVVYRTQTVEVPVVSKCPTPKTIQKPSLPVNDLTDNDINDYKKVNDAYSISLSMCMEYAEKQEKILDGYRKEINNGSEKEEK